MIKYTKFVIYNGSAQNSQQIAYLEDVPNTKKMNQSIKYISEFLQQNSMVSRKEEGLKDCLKLSPKSSVLVFFWDGFVLKVFQEKDCLCYEIWSIFGWFMKMLALGAKSKSLWINSWKQNVDKLLLKEQSLEISASVHCTFQCKKYKQVQNIALSALVLVIVLMGKEVC